MSIAIALLAIEQRELNLRQDEREQDLEVFIAEFWDFLQEKGLVDEFKIWRTRLDITTKIRSSTSRRRNIDE